MTAWTTRGFGEVPGEPGVWCDCDPNEHGRGLYYRCPVCGTRWLRGKLKYWPTRLLAWLNPRNSRHPGGAS